MKRYPPSEQKQRRASENGFFPRFTALASLSTVLSLMFGGLFCSVRYPELLNAVGVGLIPIEDLQTSDVLRFRQSLSATLTVVSVVVMASATFGTVMSVLLTQLLARLICGGSRLIVFEFSWQALSPGARLRRMFGASGQGQGSFVLLLLCGRLIRISVFLSFVSVSVFAAGSYWISGSVSESVIVIAAIGSICALTFIVEVVSYLGSYFRWYSELSMDEEECRREIREQEGDPWLAALRIELSRE